MAYNENFPADDSYLSDFPAGDREQNRALKDDQIVNAGKLQGLTVGNANGQIPINNGTENANLNAALLNGKASSYFATSNHNHNTATQSSNGYMSNADKKKLDGIASGAEVNQNAFANVKVGSNTIQADAKQDTLELAAGTNISLVGDANNDKVTIAVTGKVASASQADNATNATKATQDKNGLQIDTNYLKLSGGTMNGTLNTSKTTNTYLAGNQGQAIINSTATNGGYTMLAKMNSTNGKFTHGVYQGGYLLQYTNNTTISAGTNAVTKSVTLLDESGNTNFPGTVTAPSFNGTATKATQDSAGQTINTTYVKGVTANNATLTITKGNGSTSTTTVNNVSRAEYSDRVGTNAGYTGSTTGSSLKGGLSQSAIYNNSFPFAYGNLISVKNSGANQIALEWSGTTGAVGRVAVRSARDAGIDTWSAWRYLAYTESPAFSGSPTAPTPGTSDNGTRIATTAFVQSLINSLKGSIGGTIVASNLAQNGYVKFSNGLILQWGVGSNNMFKFPISFTKNCFCAILTRNSGTYEVALIIKNKSTSTITWEAWNSNGKVDVVPAECLVVGV
ncbi:hypothetical protein [Megamonas funiformis]|uniref:gp53-like domain-containing protein n=2 Tax=Megamonas funiformis TaxID=437897 RepID=UPI0022DFDAEA|nr:hypothetical protein [Megamonas funiformis]